MVPTPSERQQPFRLLYPHPLRFSTDFGCRPAISHPDGTL
nr:hypothetical protein JVH1_1918 [Rhodococcus sp. JVH1]